MNQVKKGRQNQGDQKFEEVIDDSDPNDHVQWHFPTDIKCNEEYHKAVYKLRNQGTPSRTQPDFPVARDRFDAFEEIGIEQLSNQKGDQRAGNDPESLTKNYVKCVVKITDLLQNSLSFRRTCIQRHM